MIDIGTFVRHLSVLILGVRDDYHQIYILRRRNSLELMEDVSDVEKSASCFWAVASAHVARRHQTNNRQSIINKSFGELLKRLKSHYDDKGKQIRRCKTLN